MGLLILLPMSARAQQAKIGTIKVPAAIEGLPPVPLEVLNETDEILKFAFLKVEPESLERSPMCFLSKETWQEVTEVVLDGDGDWVFQSLTIGSEPWLRITPLSISLDSEGKILVMGPCGIYKEYTYGQEPAYLTPVTQQLRIELRGRKVNWNMQQIEGITQKILTTCCIPSH